MFSLRKVGYIPIKWIVDFLKLVDSTNTNDVIAIGDFSIHLNKSHDSMAKFFQSTLIGHSLFQHVDLPNVPTCFR